MSDITTKPLVSIAMCTYNGERFLREQLDSLIAQDYRPLEIHIVDDQSTDNTWNILNEYAKCHDFLHIHKNDTNQGVTKNFEKALTLCHGKYISFCDQDDIWLPHKVSTHIAEIGESSLTYSELSYINENGSPIPSPKRKTNRLSGRCPLALLFHTCVTGHVALFKRNVLDHALPFPEGIQAHDHWVPFVAAGLNGLHTSDHVLSLYRAHDNNVSMKKRKQVIKGLHTRIRKRKAAFHKKLEGRIQFMQAATTSGVLTSAECALVSELINEHRRLTSCVANRSLRKLMMDHAGLLLPIYRNPAKILSRFPKGQYYYELTLYAKKP